MAKRKRFIINELGILLVRFRKSYLLPLLAIISLVAIAAYELYWIKGLYKTRREAAVSEIRVSITWAEMEELTARRKQSSEYSCTLLITGNTASRMS